MEVWTPQDLLAINVVWNRTHDSVVFTELEMDHSVAFGAEEKWSPINQPQTVTWSLKGVVKRTTQEITRGHYIAIVCYGQSWFHINDDIVQTVISPENSLDIGRAPVLLLYERDGLSDSDTRLRSSVRNPPVRSPDNPADRRPANDRREETKVTITPAIHRLSDTGSPSWSLTYSSLTWTRSEAVRPLLSCVRGSTAPLEQSDIDERMSAFRQIWEGAAGTSENPIMLDPKDMKLLLRPEAWWTNFLFIPLMKLFA